MSVNETKLDVGFNARELGGDPANFRTIFTSPETRMILLPGSENRMIVASFVWTKQRNVTDRQTDGQTDAAMANTAVALRARRTRCKRVAFLDSQCTLCHRIKFTLVTVRLCCRDSVCPSVCQTRVL